MKNSTLKMLFVAALFALGASAEAQVCVTGVGCQLPDQLGHGSGSTIGADTFDSAAAFFVQDNFVPSTSFASDTIYNVCWWGFYVDFISGPFDCAPGGGDDFTVTYYTDAGGSPGSIFAGPFSVTPTSAASGNTIASGIGPIAEYEYTASHTPVIVLSGTQYWVEISNNAPADCYWLWSTAPPGNGVGFQNGAATDYDLAYCLDIPFASALPPPANDACANAVAVSFECGDSVVVAGTTVNSLNDLEAISCGISYDGGQGVWYTVVGTGNQITADLCNGNTTYDSKLHVYSGSCGTLSCVTSNDDFCGGQSSVSWQSASGETYYILVNGFFGATGDFELTIEDGPDLTPPSIVCPEVLLGCNTTASSDVGQDIINGSPFGSTIVISGVAGTLSDVNVVDLDITHTWSEDIEVSLTSPGGTTVQLVNDPCGSDDDLFMSFDDAGLATGSFPCPATDGLAYAPEGLLSSFNGEDPNGIWILNVNDDAGGDDGTLNGWSIELCTSAPDTLVYVTDAGNCDVVISGAPSPFFDENCPGATLVNDFNNTNDASGTYPLGITEVEWIATDTAGNADTCSIFIKVEDNEDPEFVCGVSNTITTCNDYASVDVPITITTTGGVTYTSDIVVSGAGTSISDVNVDGLDISHTWISDLDITLTSPLGTVVNLADFTSVCGSEDNALISFDDSGLPSGSYPCPPTDGLVYAPDGSLASLNGEDPNGTWVLSVTDNAGGDGGSLNAWSLEICTDETITEDTVTVSNDFGLCGAIFTYTAPVGTDNCPGVGTVQIAGLGSGALFPVGTNTETYVATDAAGNTDTCHITIIVEDDEAPQVSCVTAPPTCNTTASTDVPVALDDAALPFGGFEIYTSEINITDAGIASDVNLLDLDISHTWVNDLFIWVTSPSGTEVVLFPQDCGGDEDIFMSFDDQGAAYASWPCPPIDGLAYQGAEALSAFNGESITGTWTLTVVDAFTGSDLGTLNGWSLEICTGGDNNIFVANKSGVCEANVSLPAPAAFDNCGGSLTYVNDFNNTNDASGLYPVGTTVVTWTITDTTGNEANCEMIVTVADTTAPVIDCGQGDVVLYSTDTECEVGFTYPTATASDNCPFPAAYFGADAIPDADPAGLSVPVSLSGLGGNTLGGDINLESVCLDITHSWVGDLVVTLESPGGVVIPLIDQIGVPAGTFGCSGANIDACFELGTGNPAEDVCGPNPALSGTFTAVSDLVAMNDGSTDPNGVWTLFISDNGGGDVGQLNSVVLNFDVLGADAAIVQVEGLPSGSDFPVGVTNNTFVVTDGSGNTDTCSFTVTVVDTLAPVLACPDTTVQNETGLCGATVDYTEPVGVDNCDPVMVTHSLSQDIVFANSVACNSGLGHTDNSYFRVFDLSTDFGFTNDFFVDSVDVGIESATSGSGLGQPAVVNLHLLSGPLTFGNLTLLYTDTLVIEDTTNAILTIPLDSQVTIPAGSIFAVEFFTPNGQANGDFIFVGSNADGETDDSYLAALDCGLPEPGTTTAIGFPGMNWVLNVNAGSHTEFVSGLGTGAFFPVGETEETFATVDLYGNEDTCSFLVIVEDTTAPVIACLTSDVVCNTTVSTDVPVAIDDPALPFGGFEFYTSELTVSETGFATDVNLLDLDISHTWVNDLFIFLTSPSGTEVVLFPQDCGADADIFMSFDDQGAGYNTWPCPPVDGLAYQGAETLSAFNGESINGTWTLTVVDAFTGLDEGTLNGWGLEICTGGDNNFTFVSDSGVCEGTVSLGQPAFSDNCPGAWLENSYNGTSDASDVYPVGQTVVEWYAIDSAGNADTCEIVVIVNDTEAPVIVCANDTALTNDTGQCGAVVDYTITATDNCPLPTLVQGETYSGPTAIPDGDPAGMEYELTPTGAPGSATGSDVFVESVCVDITHSWVGDLIITLESPNGTVVELMNNVGGPGLGCSDDNVNACFETGTGNSVDALYSCGSGAVSGTFTANTDLAALDDGSNPNGTWTLFVSDNAALDPGELNSFTVNFGDPTQDNIQQIAGLASGSEFPVGVTTNTFVIEDFYGNADTCSFDITVTDDEDPVWACIGDTTVDQETDDVCFAIVDWVPPVASDNCGVDTVYSTHEPGDIFSVGTTTVTYTAVDTSGNMSTCSFNVTVLDIEDPTLVGCPSDVTLANTVGDCSTQYFWTQPVAGDNCSEVTLEASHDPGFVFPVGLTTVTYTATDSSGNVATCSFDVTVEDTEAPEIVCADDVEVCGEDQNGATVTYNAPTATDNCELDTIVMISGLESGSLFPVGSTLVEYVATDTAGNADTCSFTVVVYPTPEFTVDVVNVSCNGASDASLTVNTSFGNAPFDFILDGGTAQSSNVFDGLSGGTYVVTVVSADGCERMDTVTVEEPEPLVMENTSVIVLCKGESTGEIAAQVEGGTLPYEYSVDGGVTYQPDSLFTDLPAGGYPVRVRDANGCTEEVTVEITEPSIELSAVSNVTDALCFGTATGEIEINATGGTGAYEYSLDGVNYQSGNTFTGLAASGYNVTVRDANGCTAVLAVTVGEPASAISIAGSNVTDASCFGDANGLITVVAAGGTPGYVYSVDGGVSYQSGSTFNGLAAGVYIVSAKDTNGCVVSDTLEVFQPDLLQLDVVSVTKPSCEGEPTGTIVVEGTGGTVPYEYSIDGGTTTQASGTFTGLESRLYTVQVVDQKGCFAEITVQLDHINPLPIADFAMTITGGSVQFNNLSANGQTYEWDFGDDSTSTDINPIHTYATGGSYVVTLIATNLCGSDTIEMDVDISISGIGDVEDGISINIYPNPTKGSFNVEYVSSEKIGKLTFRMIGIDGKLIVDEQLIVESDGYTRRFDKNEFSQGVYVIQITTDKGVYHQRLIIER